jgi:hypothetical protein
LTWKVEELTLVIIERVYLSMEAFHPFDGTDLSDISIRSFMV